MLSYATNRKAFARVAVVHRLARPPSAFPLMRVAAPYVEFDFARSAECRDVTPPERIAQVPSSPLCSTCAAGVGAVSWPRDGGRRGAGHRNQRRRGRTARDRFLARARNWPATSRSEIETTTTTKRARSLDGTLGGGLPVPVCRPGGACLAVDQCRHFRQRNGHRKDEPPAAQARDCGERHILGRPRRISSSSSARRRRRWKEFTSCA